MIGTPDERFDAKWRKVQSGCWEWTAHRIKGGYGQFTSEKARYMAHRWSYERAKGPIPEGLELDHLCRNRACVNPDHLEPVTSRENLMRSPIAPARLNSAKSHCPKGHALSGSNLYISPAQTRSCLRCRRETSRRFDAIRPPRRRIGSVDIAF